MKYNDVRNIKDLLTCFNEGQKIKYVFFWGHTPAKESILTKSCFSQWYKHSFEAFGVNYKTAEHYMMAEKARLFNDQVTCDKILNSEEPGEAKKLGRQVKNFADETWNKKRFEIVSNASYYKFSSCEKLREYLVNTENRVLVEASPRDKIWGIGLSQNAMNVENPLTWKGENLLGFALMNARDKLIKEKGN